MTDTRNGAAAAPARKSVVAELAGLPRAFWMVNVMEMLERLAYYGVRVVIPIYIAQADEIGGLHFSQTDKGLIFMLWALVQTGVPVFSGAHSMKIRPLSVWLKCSPPISSAWAM